MSNRPTSKKFGLGMVLTIFSFVTIFGSIAFAQPAKAQFAVTTLTDFPSMIRDLAAKIKEGLKGAVMGAVQKSVSYFMRKVAYDSAVYLASGGKGQAPFANTSEFGNYLENVAGDAFGEAITALGQPFGLDLCKVPDVKIDLAIKIGLKIRAGEPITSSNCDWNSFVDGWSADTWKSKYGSVDALQKQFNVSLKADPDADLGIYLKSVNKIDNIVSKKTEAATLSRQEGQGFKDFTTLISGSIKTPAQIQKLQAEANAPSEQQKKSEAQINAAFASGMFNILPQTLGLFLDTLASQMVKNFQENGMFPFGVCIGEYGGDHCKSTKFTQGSVASYEGSGVKIGGREAAQGIFSQFLVAEIKTADNYNILGELENCPTEAPTTYNCRIDGYMVQAVQEANYGKPVTIEEALKKNWIHPDWKLLNSGRPENKDLNCKDSAYCYANIKVLRQLRILPLGFELAALNSPSDHPWTVKQVVDGFYDCRHDTNGNVVYDQENFPFCHLIDPNWVLKIEPTRCNSLVNAFSPMIAEAPQRVEDCVDLSTCVAYNNDGTCLSYSYCMREKNVWRFEGNKCDSYYSTCKAFTDSTGKSVGYLYRTLDTSYCNEGTSGCTAYSLNQDLDGWLSPGFNSGSQYYNNGIHFNSNISTSCGSNSFGCSAFKVASTTDVLYLRKAPDYLGCYDANPGTSAIDWPKNSADLSKIQPKQGCSLYSGVCTELEVGCNLFTSLLTGENIPGKFKSAEVTNGVLTAWNDQCDAKCDGYAAYREMPNNYSNGRSVAYIIPSSGNTCVAEEEGCSSFTNMAEVSAGGEKVEYYSYLRPCIKPDAAKQKNFYTYEGNKDGGYQLKTYILEKDVDGSPKYWYRTVGDLSTYANQCNEANYKAGLSDADCRQFNDDSGNVYYKLLSKAIAVNSSCTYYRLNSSEMVSPGVCFQNGEYKDGFCYYNGLPSGVQTTAGASKSCSANVESCFAYKGNTANNVQEIFQDDFETNNLVLTNIGWSINNGSFIVSTESTHYGEHSLGYTGNGNVTKILNGLTPGKSYVLTFWAKGDKRKVEASLNAGTSNKIGNFDTTDVWQYYKFSPIELNGNTTTVQLVFGGSAQGSNLFLDNVRLVEVTDYLYLVRNSLKVDAVCDSNLEDNLPGEALGCSGYKVSGIADSFYLTNFSYLCRDGAIGCTAMLDTYNTLTNEKPDAYNVWLAGNGISSGTKTITMSDGKAFSCVIPVGESGCYTDISGYTKEAIEAAAGVGSFVSSTVYIPADTPSNAPIYLVATAANSCNSADLGCTYAGVESITPNGIQFATATIKNDPANYATNLCESEAVGCGAYTSGASNYYFKDPAVTGQKVCAYKSGVKVGDQLSSGWFWKNVGVCSSNSNLNCSNDADCGTGTCDKIGNVPCYLDYKKVGSNFDIWSFGDTGKYENFVGECPTAQSDCTEYVDNNDKDEAGNGRSYYYINNSLLGSGDCDGLASLKYGCVLFDQVDKTSKLWNTAATYLNSENNDSQKVAPNTSGNKDANVIIKVERDRECGEWIECRRSHRVWNKLEGKWNTICDYIDRCNAAPETNQENSPCASYVDKTVDPNANKILSLKDYIERDTDWSSEEYSGFYMFGMYQADELEQKNISNNDVADWRLVKKIPCGTNEDVCVNPSSANKYNYDCKMDKQDSKCGLKNEGKCKNGSCVQNHKGGIDFAVQQEALTPVCRAYPENDSPFPFTSNLSASKLFSGVNLCSETTAATNVYSDALKCDCDYTKAVYGSGYLTKYFNFDNPNSSGAINYDQSVTQKSLVGEIPEGICQGGDSDGHACEEDADCGGGTNGSCQKMSKAASRLVGLHGYCLEKDISRTLWSDPEKSACLSWYPVDTIAGYIDINNQNQSAGYDQPVDHGRYYCTKSASVMGKSEITDLNPFKKVTRGTVDQENIDLASLMGGAAVVLEGAVYDDNTLWSGEWEKLKCYFSSLDTQFSCDDKRVEVGTPDYCFLYREGLNAYDTKRYDCDTSNSMCSEELVQAIASENADGGLSDNQIDFSYFNYHIYDNNGVDKLKKISCDTGSVFVRDPNYYSFASTEIKIDTGMGCDQDCGSDLNCRTSDRRRMPYDEPGYGGDKDPDNIDGSRYHVEDPVSRSIDDVIPLNLQNWYGNFLNNYEENTTDFRLDGYLLPNQQYSLDYASKYYIVGDDKFFIRIKVNQPDPADYSCNNSARVFWPAKRYGATSDTKESDFQQQDIEYIKFEVTDSDKEDMYKNTPIYLYPNEYAGLNKSLMSFTTNNDANGGSIIVGNLSGNKSLPVFFYSEHRDDENKVNDVFGADGKLNTFGTNKSETRLSGNLFGDIRHGNSVYENDIAFFEAGVASDDICKNTPNDLSWHGVVAQFNSSTKYFQGFWMFYCDGRGGNNGFVNYKVTFKLRENCTQVADVTVDYLSIDNRDGAVADTNVLWNINKTDLSSIFSETGYNFNTPAGQYGSFLLNELDPYLGTGVTNFKLIKNKLIYMSSPEEFTLCKNNVLDPATLSDEEGAKNPFSACAINNNLNQDRHLRGGAPYYCPDGSCYYTGTAGDLIRSNVSDKVDDGSHPNNFGLNLLTNIFVKLKAVYNFYPGVGDNGEYYKGYTTSSVKYNFTNDESTSAPQVNAVMSDRCDMKDRCMEWGAGLTINDVYNRNLVIREKPTTVVMKFYAYADASHMPLRRIRIDWGDGTDAGRYDSLSTAFFANMRGLDDNNQPICVPESNSPDFGHILDKTCDSNYYRTQYTYNCVENGYGWKVGNDCPDETVAEEYGGCCVYVPKVQVKDNWGFCNGNGEEGYYDGNGGGENGCGDSSWYTGSNKPFTTFYGKVIVVPQ